MKKTTTLVVGALLASAGTAFAQNEGDVVYTTSLTGEIAFVSGTGPSSPTTLFDFSDIGENTRLGGIIQNPFSGDFFVTDGRVPFVELDSGIWRVDNLLSGAGTATRIQQGEPIQNAIGLAFDFQNQALVTTSNPGNPEPGSVPTNDGIFQLGYNGSNISELYDEEAFSDPRLQGLSRITNDFNSDNLYVLGVNGGLGGFVGPNGESSTLARMERDPMSGQYQVVQSSLFDFQDANTGLGFDITSARGITTVPGENAVFVVSSREGVVLRVDLDSNGDVAGVSSVLDGLTSPSVIKWNPFTDSFVMVEELEGDDDINRIVSFDLDGSNFEVLTTLDTPQNFIRGLSIIGGEVPAPGAFALAGLAGLAGLRRRRK